MLIVKKFGGTSVANKERIFNVAGRCIEEYKKGNDIYDTIQNQVLDTDTPTSVTLDDEEVEIPFVYDHKQLLSINSEGLGYLYIPSIDVRLPMVPSTDNDFY